MNRRDFLKHAFQLGAAGLILPATEPIRRYWQLDRTMLPQSGLNEFVQWSEKLGPWEKPVLTLESLEREIRAVWESDRFDMSAPRVVTRDYFALYMTDDGREIKVPMDRYGLAEYRGNAPDQRGTFVGIGYLKTWESVPPFTTIIPPDIS